MNKWYKGLVKTGDKFGTKIGFPTLNIANSDILKGQKQGVYAVLLRIHNTIYHGVLFFGPRLIRNEENTVIEIFVLDFDEQIYGQTIFFKLIKYLRPPRSFPNTKALKKQLTADCKMARKLLN